MAKDWWDVDNGQHGAEGALGARAFAQANRGRPVRAARKSARGKKSAYNVFCARLMRKGYTLAQCAAAWRIHKKGGSSASHKKAWGKVRAAHKTTKRRTSRKSAPRRAAARKTTKRRSSKKGLSAKFKKNASLGPKAMKLAHQKGISLKAAWKVIKGRR